MAFRLLSSLQSLVLYLQSIELSVHFLKCSAVLLLIKRHYIFVKESLLIFEIFDLLPCSFSFFNGFLNDCIFLILKSHFDFILITAQIFGHLSLLIRVE